MGIVCVAFPAEQEGRVTEAQVEILSIQDRRGMIFLVENPCSDYGIGMHDERICNLCKKYFPATLEYFTPSKNTIAKLDIYCRKCRREYARAWYQKNREKEVARSAKWNKENWEKVKATRRLHWSKNAEECREKIRNYRAKNKELFSFLDREKHAKRRASIKITEKPLTRSEFAKIKKASRGICFYCKGKFKKLTVDHIKPLSRGGTHSADNIVMACTHCNSAKHARDPITFAQSKGLLIV